MTTQKFHTFSLEGEGPILRGYKVLLDGNEIRGVRSLSLKAGVEDVTSLTLEMIVSASLKDIPIPEEGIGTDYSEPSVCSVCLHTFDQHAHEFCSSDWACLELGCSCLGFDGTSPGSDSRSK